MKILIITTEPYADESYPLGGRALRIKNLAAALEEKSLDVHCSFSRNFVNLFNAEENVKKELLKFSYADSDYDSVIKEVNPDIIIFSPHTLLFDFKSELHNRKIVIADMYGAIALENIYKNEVDSAAVFSSKILSLSKADAFLYSNDRQKYYYFAWLMLAGVDLTRKNFIHCPFFLKEKIKRISYPEIPQIVFSGVNWPWINAGSAIKKTADFVTEKKGKFKIITGDFLYKGKRQDCLSELPSSPYIEKKDIVGFKELIDIYLSSSAALDFYEMNTEREIASTTRTVVYFSCGLPVIYNKNMVFADLIKKYDAGWVIDTDSSGELEGVLNEIYDNKEICERKGKNAFSLFEENFKVENAVSQLICYLNQPFKPAKKKNFLTNLINENNEKTASITNLSRTLKETKEEKDRVFISLNETINSLNGAINSLKSENEFLKNDLNRIKSRFIFKVLIKLKKILNKITGRRF